MRLRRAWVMSVAGMLAGCRAPAPPVPQSVVMANVVAALAENAAADSGLLARRSGPVWVDVASFSSRDTVRLAGIGPRKLSIANASEKTAIRCRPFGGPCHVRRNGLFIRLDSLQVQSPDAFSAVATYKWTERGDRVGAIGFATYHLEFRNVGGVWRLVESRVTAIT
jgi:hypothetical protein